MFHRRLTLLLSGVALAFLVLSARAWRLAIARGDELRADAERALVMQRWTPTTRGNILDRKGRILAQDRPAFDIAVDYDVLSGEWARARARREARGANRDAWPDLSREEREALVAGALPGVQARIDAGWAEVSRITGVPRAELDARREAIIAEVEKVAMSQWQRARAQREKALSDRGKPAKVSLDAVRRPVREQKMAHVVVRDAPDAAAFELRRVAESFPGLRVLDPLTRDYPFETVTITMDREGFPRPLAQGRDGDALPAESIVVEGVATHILGWMRNKVFAEDIKRRPIRRADHTIDPGGYDANDDRAGQAGIEKGLEDSLRGSRGRAALHLDTGERDEQPPVPGADAHLSIDIMLQARVQALMTPALGLAVVQPWHQGAGAGQTILPIGTPLNGAAVVLEIDSGEILAMVTTPSFTRADLQDEPEKVFKDRVDQPWVNRCVQAPYPPGSIVKALLLAGASTDGSHDLHRSIDCTGHLFPDKPTIFRCWRYKQFSSTHNDQLGHAPGAEEALCVSCNIFFYTVGRELGPAGVEKWYRAFGLGTTWGLGLGEGVEQPGMIGAGGKALERSDAIHMGIGQGPVAWTPLHAADAYATLARGGLKLTPRLRRDAEPKALDLRLNLDAVRASMEGLRRSVNDPLGSGHHLVFDGVQEPTFNVPGVDAWGKTGTAEAPDIAIDRDGAGPGAKEVVREGDHSWFVALVAPAGDRPRFVVAVMMEYAGSGGRVSGPILNQIIRAMVIEGYLPKAPAPRSAETDERPEGGA